MKSKHDTNENKEIKALIEHVEVDSVAFEAGFEAGCYITRVNGHPLRDIIDWRWYGADDSIELDYIDLDNERGTITLERFEEEDWGIRFKGVIFDDIRVCKNNCKFCFMKQLPKGMRSSLSLRDDDFRLSFLSGTFVTLTNIDQDDIERIEEQRISPLRVSLHAISPDIRQDLIGRMQSRGIEVLERLIECGIRFDAQIVLCPNINDRDELDRTLSWAYDHPSIENIGIVPLGFTSHQKRFDASFDDPERSAEVLAQIEVFQERAMEERGYPWVYASDEFYRNAYENDLEEHLPDADFYRGFPMFEDGIGIIRSSIDELRHALASDGAITLGAHLKKEGICLHLIAGYAMEPYTSKILKDSPLAGLLDIVAVKNDYFGGNVNVTGLLTGCDIIKAIRDHASCRDEEKDDLSHIYLIPDVIFNDDGSTLDGLSFSDIETECGTATSIVASNPLDCIDQLISSI